MHSRHDALKNQTEGGNTSILAVALGGFTTRTHMASDTHTSQHIAGHSLIAEATAGHREGALLPRWSHDGALVRPGIFWFRQGGYIGPPLSTDGPALGSWCSHGHLLPFSAEGVLRSPSFPRGSCVGELVLPWTSTSVFFGGGSYVLLLPPVVQRWGAVAPCGAAPSGRLLGTREKVLRAPPLQRPRGPLKAGVVLVCPLDGVLGPFHALGHQLGRGREPTPGWRAAPPPGTDDGP